MPVAIKCAAMVMACFLNHYLPPSEYDYEPTKPYWVVTFIEREVLRICPTKWGCVILRKRAIILSDQLSGPFRDIILRHEKAHLNGWMH